MVTVQLPPFLEPFSPDSPLQLPPNCQNAQFVHSANLGSSHALWWSPRDEHRAPDIVLLFIPGNPGLVDFYIPFLSSIHEKHVSSNLAIVAHSHLDHYVGIRNKPETRYSPEQFLSIQVQSSIEVLDEIIHFYAKNTKIIVVGHSVGSWIIVQMLKHYSESIKAAFLLFPTVSNIADTPNGKLLSPIFVPLTRRILSSLSVLLGYFPRFLFARMYSSWPEQQLSVLRNFLSSKQSVFASLSMGAEEMKAIKQLEVPVLEENKEKLYAYYAQRDDWVGIESRAIFSLLDPDGQSSQIVQGPVDIPHAFCISHSEIVAQQCHYWLESLS